MKNLMFIFLVGLAACASQQDTPGLETDTFSADTADTFTNDTAPPPEFISIDASRHYNPISWEDGVYLVQHDLHIEIPTHISVVSGASGNHTSTIRFGGTGVICTYRGRADVERSNVDSEQWLKGNGYDFEGCHDGSAEGPYDDYSVGSELILEPGDQVTLSIVYGDYGTNNETIPTHVNVVIPVLR